MKLDHLRLIRNPAYAARIRQKLRALATRRGELNIVDVLHEDDGACCRREPWSVTAAHVFGPIVAEMSGTKSENVAAQWAEHEPAIVLVTGKPESAESAERSRR